MGFGLQYADLFFFNIVLVLVGSFNCIDIDFDDSKDGFFLKSPYHKFKPAEPSIVKESLILTHPAEVYKLRASYGPFEMYQAVPNEVLSNIGKYGDEVFDKSAASMHRQVIHNMDVSAHLVSQTVTHTNPVVQVLVHAQPILHRPKNDLIYIYYGYTPRWCAQILVTRGEEQYTAVCVLNGDSNACVAGLPVPEHWWDTSNSSLASQEVKVYYDLNVVEQNQECASVANTIVTARAEASHSHADKKLISSVQLVKEQLKYVDHKDKDLIFKIPDMELRPNTKFEVPVLLEKNSPLKEFVVQVKVRGGLAVEGASTIVNSPWSVYFEAGEKEGTATVTAFIKEDVKYTKSFQVEEIMKWQFRVLSSAAVPSVAKVLWTVDYEKNGLSRNAYFSPEGSRVAAKFSIMSSHTDNVVAVLKEQSVLNTAILTGQQVKHDLLIFSVSYDNSFRSVLKDSNCRTSDPETLKVTSSCEYIYMDGSEARGAKNVTILIRTADRMTQLGIQVWVPEPRLDIQLSDSKLSQVRGWKVDKGDSLGDSTTAGRQSCRHKYQQAMVDVYARFTISTPGEVTEYYRNKKTYVRVTGLIQDRLRIANPNVAKIWDGTVMGVSPGRTEVQIISPTGKLLGAKEIRVGKDKVEIERLMVRVISGMSLHISEDRNLPGALLATLYLKDQLVADQQEAVLDIAVEFKDGTMLPLSSIDPSEYDLTVTSVNTAVVEVTESIASAPSLPASIKANGNGKGEIVRVILRESGACQRKKPRTLDTEYVHVQVDFAKNTDFYNFYNTFNSPQRDQFASNHVNAAGDRGGVYGRQPNKKEYFEHEHEQNFLKGQLDGKRFKPGPKVVPVKDLMDQSATYTPLDSDSENTKEPKSEALEQAVSTKAKHPSPLEIGMYVLVAVFVFAILVFTANCAVFMVRYQRKRSPKGSRVMTGSISQAPDWVWIGRATLERHGAGNAGCNHALMAEEDFNGNQMVVPNSLSTNGKRQTNGDSVTTSSTSGVTGSASTGSGSNRNSMVSTYKGSECSIRITSNPLPDEDCGMGYNEAEWDYEAMGMTYEQLMEYFDNLKESSA